MDSHSLKYVFKNRVEELTKLLEVLNKLNKYSNLEVLDYGEGPVVGYNNNYGNTYLCLEYSFEFGRNKEDLNWDIALVVSDFNKSEVQVISTNNYDGNEVTIELNTNDNLEEIIYKLKREIYETYPEYFEGEE